jgi:hypothetical protein
VAQALAPHGVTVNCVNPGPTDTGYLTGAEWEAVRARFPAGRWGAPEDAARLVAFLLGPSPSGSDVSSGTYRCTECGYDLQVTSVKHLPPCPRCANGAYETVSGGDAADDPYPGS